MRYVVVLGCLFGTVLLSTSGAVAHDRRDGVSQHPKSSYYRHRGASPQVRGYVIRRGGYSYNYSDSVNTYGSSRTLYGSTPLYRDPMIERQSPAGPFDHGFFFDSAIGPHGGQSPYMQ